MTEAYYVLLCVLMPLALLVRGGRLFGVVLSVLWFVHAATNNPDFWWWLAREGINVPIPLRSYADIVPDAIASAVLALMATGRPAAWKFAASAALWVTMLAHGLFWVMFLTGAAFFPHEYVWGLRLAFVTALAAVVWGNWDGTRAVEAIRRFGSSGGGISIRPGHPLGRLHPASSKSPHES